MNNINWQSLTIDRAQINGGWLISTDGYSISFIPNPIQVSGNNYQPNNYTNVQGSMDSWGGYINNGAIPVPSAAASQVAATNATNNLNTSTNGFNTANVNNSNVGSIAAYTVKTYGGSAAAADNAAQTAYQAAANGGSASEAINAAAVLAQTGRMAAEADQAKVNRPASSYATDLAFAAYANAVANAAANVAGNYTNINDINAANGLNTTNNSVNTPNAIAGASSPFTNNAINTDAIAANNAANANSAAVNTLTTSINNAGAATLANPAAGNAPSYIPGNINNSAVSLSVTGFPTPSTIGAMGNLTVTAKDVSGNTVTGYLGTIHFTSSDVQAKLPADYTFVVADQGSHIFNNGLMFNTTGTQSVTATDTITPNITGLQSGIVINGNNGITMTNVASLAITGFPVSIVAGNPGNIIITAKDTNGNTMTGYLGTVHFTSSDNKAQLPADYTFTGADAGVHMFNNGVILQTIGAQSITVTDTSNGSILGTQSNISVGAR